jgi:uncharacterized repeat protein (TIGR03803 family)
MKTIFAAVVAAAAGCVFLQAVSNAHATTYQERILYSFDAMPGGWTPYGGVIRVGGRLYGTANAGGNEDAGVLFALGLRSHREKALFSFDAEDGYPEGNLTEMKGMLYGAASGLNGFGGLVFSFDPGTKAMTPIYGFCGQANCADGAYPVSVLTTAKGILYGTTLGGGQTGCGGLGCGTVFSVDPGTHAERVLHAFCSEGNCADGRWPGAGLIEVNGLLYGTATYGAVPGCVEQIGCGVVFSLNRRTGAEKVLHAFCSEANCADGATPRSGLVAVNGLLYGTTAYGGASGCQSLGCGTAFSIDPKTGVEKVLYDFCSQPDCADGAVPQASLIEVDGTLYGTTTEGGGTGCHGGGCGTVFALDPSTGAETVLYAFGDAPDGQFPNGLIEVNGTLYGTTIFGGAGGYGTVFALEPQKAVTPRRSPPG